MEMFLVTFQSTHASMKAQKKLKIADFSFDLIPTPRKISSECGFSAMVYANSFSELVAYLSAEKMDFEEIYICKNKQGERFYEKTNS